MMITMCTLDYTEHLEKHSCYKRSFFYKHLLCAPLCQAVCKTVDQRCEDLLHPHKLTVQ